MSYKKIVGTSVPDVDLTKSDAELTRKERIAKTQATKGWSSQGVYDEQGRQRFHGAFTGGFSAGYYNTVGSKEGFTPKSYHRSREQRAAPVSQSITDFMDAEDLADMDFGGRSGGRLKIASDFARPKPDSRSETSRKDSDSSLPLLVPFELISHSADTVGYRLLKLMGWTEGRAVGPKRLALTEEDETLAHRFDSKLVRFDDKSNTFGLGYNPFSFSSELGASKKPVAQPTKRSMRMEMSSQLVADDDDLIYGSTSRNHPTFDNDIDLGQEEEEYYAFNMQPSRRLSASKPAKRERSSAAPKGVVPSDIPGFVRALTAPVPTSYFPPPQVPSTFNPIHKFPASVERSEGRSFESVPHSTLTSADRSRLLGEQMLSSSSSSSLTPPSTVFSQPSLAPPAQTAATSILSLKSRFTSDPRHDSHPLVHHPPQRHPSTTGAPSPPVPKPSTIGILSSAMSKRFVPTKDKSSDELEAERSQGEGVEMQHDAARAGMFGKLTRRIEEWTPSSLLCKRMSVHNPVRVSRYQPPASMANVVTTNQSMATRESAAELSSPTFLAMVTSTSSVSSPLAPSFGVVSSNWRFNEGSSEVQRGPQSDALIPSGADEVKVVADLDKEDADANTLLPAIRRPPIDLFKSIFEDDDQGDDDDDNDDDGVKGAAIVAPLSSPTATASSAADAKYYAQSFFERLAQDVQSSTSTLPSATTRTTHLEEDSNPTQPPQPRVNYEGPSLPSSRPYDRDSEGKARHKEKHKHKHKEKHRHKEKHKHRHKDRSKSDSKKRSRYSSDSGSSSSSSSSSSDESGSASSRRRDKRSKYRD